MKLYELSTQYRTLVDILEAAQSGEEVADLEVIKDTLDAIEGAIEEKADSIARIMAELSSVELAISAEVERLSKRAATIKKQKESLKSYLMAAMETAGKEKFKTNLYSYSIRNNSPSVQIVDESLIPAEYIRTKIETAPDKKAIAELLKQKIEVAGCALVQSRTVTIK